MIAFTLLVTIWMGPDAYKFKVWSRSTFMYEDKCELAAERLSKIIIAKATQIRAKDAIVVRQCAPLVTNES